MKTFTQFFIEIDQTSGNNEKIEALVQYFTITTKKDMVWAIALFSNKRPGRTISTSLLRQWASEKADLPLWLFEETYHIVGDLAETISLVLPEPKQSSDRSLSDWITHITSLKNASLEEKKAFVLHAWDSLSKNECFLFNKLSTDGFRMGVSSRLVIKALSKYTGLEENMITHRLMGNWNPETTKFEDLVLKSQLGESLSKPYPFYLAYALEKEVNELGDTDQWIAEWKWDGIRGQIIKRKNQLHLWSRGEELITEKFPEFSHLLSHDSTDFVIDGELVGFKNGNILSFNLLQTRIGRKNISKKILESCPVIMIAYDLLELNGMDMRPLSLLERRESLSILISNPVFNQIIVLSKSINFRSWENLEEMRLQSREQQAEGLMLKKKSSIYETGRKKGNWWKWKVDPLTIDAVMIYAQRGHGRRANLYTDFTFAIWNETGDLLPITKAYSGLSDLEFQEISTWVKKNTIERFGPVSKVTPILVFEIAFEGITFSNRHKSGMALRFPRIKRWRKDKTPLMADHLQTLHEMAKKI